MNGTNAHGLDAAGMIKLGELRVAGNAIRIGDANYPAVGTRISTVPNGSFAVTGNFLRIDADEVVLTSFRVIFGDGGDATEEVVDFAIDGGVVGIAGNADPSTLPFWSRRRFRRQRHKRILRGLKQVPRNIYAETLDDVDESSSMVAFHTGDGIFRVRVVRAADRVASLQCVVRPD